MSDFSGDNNINRIIELIIKSSKTNQTSRYLTHLQKIAMSKYKSYIDMQKKEEVEEQEEVREEEQDEKKYNLNPFPCIASYPLINSEYKLAYKNIIQLIIDNTSNEADAKTYIENLKRITINRNNYIDTTYKVLKEKNIIQLKLQLMTDLKRTTGEAAGQGGGKRKSKAKM